MTSQTATSQSTTSPVPIVAIGASAGGLEAVTELLENLPPTTGLAYVYIQAADPGLIPDLQAILGRSTTMPVVVAGQQTPVEPNQVYVIPANQDMAVVDNMLSVMPPVRRSTPHMPVNQFFISLANRHGGGAIGVVLSGEHDDGVQGLKAIKAAGGFMFAQDNTALFQTLPASAIAEGVVDQVLSPAQIAAELVRLSRQPDVFHQLVVTDELEEIEKGQPNEDLKPIIQELRNKVGVDFTHYKISTIWRRIFRRMLLFRIDTLPEYTEYLKRNPTEITALYGDLLINVTSFFRDAEPMDYLKKVLLPRLIKEKTSREPLRIWVPACSTGQEAYSLAILLLEVLGERAASNIQIFATDLSEQAIIKARLGSYSPAEVMDVSARRLQQFFTKTDNHYRISKTVRDLCIFAPHNLFRDPPFSRVDLISCRNLLIYVDKVLQRKAFTTFHYALNPMGYLLLGTSETAGTASGLFVQSEKTIKIYTRKNDVINWAAFNMNSRTGDGGSETKSFRVNKQDGPLKESSRAADLPAGRPINNLDQTVDSLLLRRHVPASVVVNADLDILQSRGSTGLYLELAPGKASLNLLKMARPSLTFELRNAVHKAQRQGQPVRKAGLEIKVGDKTHMVAIEAEPIDTESDERLFLVTFQEIYPESVLKNSAKAHNSRIRELEEELATVRRDMHSIVEEQEVNNEELQSANEEIVSSNEELQSINEELETNKEEIESTNEELRTINQELQVRNEQLSEAYAFSEAVFATVREATLVIDPAGRVLSVNSAFYELFGFQEGQVTKRVLYELADRQWDNPVLRQWLDEVFTQDIPMRGFELIYKVSDGAEKILSLNARRVVHQQQQESILMAIEDITEQRRVRGILEEREAWFHALVDNTPAMTWVANADGDYTYLNRAWLAYTGLPAETNREQDWITGIYPDDRESYLALYQTHVADRQPFTAEYRLRRHDGRYRWVVEQAHPITSFDQTFSGFIGTSVDIHLQRELNQELERTVEERTAELKAANRKGLTQQEILKNQLTLLQQSEDVAKIGSWEYNRATGQFIWSDGMYQLFDRERNGQITPEVYLAAAPDWNQLSGQGIVDFIYKGEGSFDDIVQIKGREGVKTLRIKAAVESNGLGNRVLGVDIDMTDQLQAQKQIEQIANNLQAVLNNSPAAIGFLKAVFDNPDPIVGDPVADHILDFRLVAVNEKFARLVGETLISLRGHSVDRLANWLWHENTLAKLIDIVKRNESIYEERQFNEDGETRWLGFSAVKHDGGVVLTGLDITEFKSMQEKQENLLDQVKKSGSTVEQIDLLQQQMRARGDLLRTSSHDLRGSLGIIQGAAELLNIVDSDEERTQMLDMLQRNVRETARLITELLDYSRLEAGQQQVTIGSFDAAELLRKLGENVRPLLERKSLHLYLLGEDTLSVEGDALNVLRMAQNLVLNALKYTHQGSISLHWGSNGPDTWYFSVEDTGPGMDRTTADTLSHGPPESAGTTTTSGQDADADTAKNAPVAEFARVEKLLGSAPGEGIGLVIVRQLCGLLQGRLAVESIAGQGSIFRITLPRRYPSEV